MKEIEIKKVVKEVVKEQHLHRKRKDMDMCPAAYRESTKRKGQK